MLVVATRALPTAGSPPSTTRPQPSGAAKIDSGWRRILVTDRTGAAGTEHYLMAAGSGGLVVLAPDGGCRTWFSRDGKVWQPGDDAGLDEPIGEKVIVSVGLVASWKDGFLAVGQHIWQGPEEAPSETASAWVWFLRAGEPWVTQPGDPSFAGAVMSEAAVAHDRIVLAGIEGGSSRGPRRAMTWTSLDAREWRPPASGSDPFTGFDRVHVTAAPEGFVAWADTLTSHQRTEPVLWSSRDGSSWQAVPTGGAFAGVGIDRIAQVGSELLAVTTVGCTKRFLVSSDARSWRSAATGSEPDASTLRCASEISAVAAGRAGIVIGGGDRLVDWNSGTEKPALWFSRTGRSWHRIAIGQLLASTEWGAISFAGIAALGDGFVVAGGLPVEPGNKPSFVPAVWLWSGR
jgi:hypothetical protein